MSQIKNFQSMSRINSNNTNNSVIVGSDDLKHTIYISQRRGEDIIVLVSKLQRIFKIKKGRFCHASIPSKQILYTMWATRLIPHPQKWKLKQKNCFLGWPKCLLTNYIWGQSSWSPLGNTRATHDGLDRSWYPPKRPNHPLVSSGRSSQVQFKQFGGWGSDLWTLVRSDRHLHPPLIKAEDPPRQRGEMNSVI